VTSVETRVFAALDGALIGSTSVPASPSTEKMATPAIPVIALHGWGRNRHDFDALAGIGAVTAFDLPGFGASPAPSEPWGARDYARIIASAIDADEAIDTARTGIIVVGHSFGGRVALCLAAERPDLVAGVVVSGVPILRNTRPSRAAPAVRWAKWLRRWHLISQERLEAVRFRHGSADYRAATGIMRQILVTVVNEDYRNELAEIRCPVTLIWGAVDTAAPMAQAIEAISLLGTRAELIELPGGHFAVFDDPAVLADAITAIRRRIATEAHP
jgi:pimeloyl-ACP methyl ester carboxylesterase